MRAKNYLLLMALIVISCNQGMCQKTKPANLELETYTEWVTKYEETECYELSIPNYFGENNPITIQFYYNDEGNEDQSTINLIDKNGDFLITHYEPITVHPMAMGYTKLVVGDIDGNGLKDIRMEFPYMGNGLMACAVRTIYIFQEKDKIFNKVSFDSFVCTDQASEIDADGDGKWEIIARTLEYIDENNYYWIDNIYKYTPEGLVCVSEENGYPKAINTHEAKSTDAKIVNKNKKGWIKEKPEGYLFFSNSK
ncbi:MAG: hypothetical protein ACOXZ9_06300 [Bacteroidales bacterium]|jgi:hypothetical protein